MIYGANSRVGGQLPVQSGFVAGLTEGASNVAVGDLVVLASGVLQPATSISTAAMGWLMNTPLADTSYQPGTMPMGQFNNFGITNVNNECSVLQGLPGIEVEMAISGNPTTMPAATYLNGLYEISGASGAQVVNLGGTTHPVVRLLRFKYNVDLGYFTAIVELNAAIAQV